MEFILFRFFAFLSVAFVASHAAQSSEDYWRSVLPNTPIPKSISELLQSSAASWVYNAAAGGINRTSNKNYDAFAAGGIIDSKIVYNIVYNSELLAAGGIIDSKIVYNSELLQSSAAGGVNRISNKNHGSSPPAGGTLDRDFFFLQKDLHQGTNMNIHFTKFTTPTPFLPRNLADSIPFSSKKLPEIFSKFSVKQNTLASKIMKITIGECEAPGNKGEEKYCATSLENMIDFATSRLGKKVNAVSTDVEKDVGLQRYRILGIKKLGEETVVCHRQNYAYAVFYCHKLNNVKAYAVSLTGNDGTKARAAVICHMDTSSWNPEHIAFQVLHVKPGSSVSVCHFLERDSVVWVSY